LKTPPPTAHVSAAAPVTDAAASSPAPAAMPPMGVPWESHAVLTPASQRAGAAAAAPRERVLRCTCLSDGRLLVLQSARVLLWERAPRGAATQGPGSRPVSHSESWVHTTTFCAGACDSLSCVAFETELDAHAHAGQMLLFATAGVLCGADGRPEAAGGAVVFRIDPLGSSDFMGWGAARAPAALHPPARRCHTESAVTCAAMLRTFFYDDGGGAGTIDPGAEGVSRLLALGCENGRVQLLPLSDGGGGATTPPLLLPAPHDTCAIARREGAGADDGWPLLALVCVAPRAEMGLLVGGYQWGAALWQAPNRVLLNVFGRAEPHAQLPSLTPGDCAGMLISVSPSGADALPTPGAGTDGRRRLWTIDETDEPDDTEVGPNEVLGFVAVSAEWRWRPISSDLELVHSFALTRAGCTPHRSFLSPLAEQGRGTDAIVGLAANGAYLAGTLRSGWACVWSQANAACLRMVRASPDALLFPCISTSLSAAAQQESGSPVVILQPCGNAVLLHACTMPRGADACSSPSPVPLAVCSVGADGPTPRRPWEPSPPPPMPTAAPAAAVHMCGSQSLSGFADDMVVLSQRSEADSLSSTNTPKPQFVY